MTCYVCGGAQRISVIDEPTDSLRTRVVMGDGRELAAVSHCRNEPAHDLGEPYLSLVLALRKRLTPEQWDDNSPSPWKGGYRYGEAE